MELDSEFVRLPLRFDVSRLAAEVLAFAETDWRKHPQGHAGNTALPLVASGGNPDNDDVRGPMRPTPYLDRCPYLQQVLGSFQAVIGRTRLMRIEGNGEATAHTDTNYYWMQRVRIHVPIITFPTVDFLCGNTTVNMPAGECWIFDTWRLHNVLNRQVESRIHLVSDSVGSPEFWNLVAQGDRPGDPAFSRPSTAKRVEFLPDRATPLSFEAVNFPIVMSPGEQRHLMDWLLGQLESTSPGDVVRGLKEILQRFHWQWRALWARFGMAPDGFDEFRAARQRLEVALKPFEQQLKLRNNTDLVEALRQAIVRPAVNADLAPNSPSATKLATAPPLATANQAANRASAAGRGTTPPPRFDRPIFVVSAPRSGSSLLFETLSRSPTVFTIGGESHAVIEGLPQLGPAQHHWESNRLTAADADPATIEQLHADFLSRLRDRAGIPPHAGQPIRFLEKTPKNALRIPFLRAAFPSARFIYLVREPQEAVSSILEAWKSGRFVTYPQLPGWDGPWSLLLTPGWRDLSGRSPAEIAAAQWETTNRILLDDLEQLSPAQWCAVSYSDLVNDAAATVRRLCDFAEIEWDEDLSHGTLPLARHTLTPPAPDKWKQNESVIRPLLAPLEPTINRIRKRRATSVSSPLHGAMATPADNANPGTAPLAVPSQASNPRQVPPPMSSSQGPTPVPTDQASLKSQYTSTIPQLLTQLGVSLMITTYQAGQLVIARVDEHGKLNTHFRSFPAPMGLALDGDKLAIGTKHQIWTLRNQPAHGKSIDARVDACFVPRVQHVTGDIRVHEIDWCGEELWIVNTRFSCLCTLDPRYSFVPRWKPPFITAYTPDDRCHLNGLAVVDGRPKYCTALGTTDSAGAWRENKPSGGILLDVDSGEVVARGLSMPHSPRLYRGKLWILNSGHGGLEVVDPRTGKTESVARLPGFTRGLDFCGDFAFIGLSQVRETAVFSGIPISEQGLERQCGVWVVDLRSGKTVGFLRFTDQVQEIFAVKVLPDSRFPEVAIDEDQIGGAFVLPDEALAQVPKSLLGTRAHVGQ